MTMSCPQNHLKMMIKALSSVAIQKNFQLHWMSSYWQVKIKVNAPFLQKKQKWQLILLIIILLRWYDAIDDRRRSHKACISTSNIPTLWQTEHRQIHRRCKRRVPDGFPIGTLGGLNPGRDIPKNYNEEPDSSEVRPNSGSNQGYK